MLNVINPPKEIYQSVADWYRSGTGIGADKGFFQRIYPNTPFSKRNDLLSIWYPDFLDGGYVGIIPNGRVWGHHGAVISPDNRLIWDVSLEFVKNQKDHSVFKQDKLPPISQTFDTVADLTHVGSRNYYHWMFEVLPKLHLLQKSGIKIDKFIVKHDQEHLPFQDETLSGIGIQKEQLIKTYPGFHVKANNLVVPSQPSFVSEWAYLYLRKTFLDTVNKTTGDTRLYISRKRTRKIINESELMDLLSQYGFVKIELEKLSVAKQIELFSNAEIIIAAHGAGLTNLAFCSPGTKILEIFSPNYVNCLYWIISVLGNLDYHFLIGDYGEREPEFINDDWKGLDNITIKMEKMRHTLKKMNIEKL